MFTVTVAFHISLFGFHFYPNVLAKNNKEKTWSKSARCVVYVCICMGWGGGSKGIKVSNEKEKKLDVLFVFFQKWRESMCFWCMVYDLSCRRESLCFVFSKTKRKRNTKIYMRQTRAVITASWISFVVLYIVLFISQKTTQKLSQ